MIYWLVCKTCGLKEAIQSSTNFSPCPHCGAERYTEDEDGKPYISWSTPQDPFSFEESR